MTREIRELADKWLALPWHTQVEIAEKLGLATKEERGLTHQIYGRKVFSRAGAQNKTEEFSKEVRLHEM